MRRVALKIAYIGTNFYGFQRQPGLKTVEGELLKALKNIGLITAIDKCGFGLAGRTDRGVHSLGNVVSFLTEGDVRINQINDVLPQSIRILGQAKVPLHFKTRYAKNRHYRYLVLDEQQEYQDNYKDKSQDAYKKMGNNHDNYGYGYDIPSYDLNKMIEASKIFEGTHNFQNFSKRSGRNPIRTIDQLKVQKKGNVIQVDVTGESFLWNMVRKIVFVLLRAGKGDLNLDDIYDYFDPQKSASIQPMPPEGLILMDVNYNDLKFCEDTYAINKFIKSLKDNYLKQQTIALSEREMIRSLMYYK